MSSRSQQPDRRVETVYERLEIFDLFNLYGEALDDKQWSLLDEILADDVSATWFGEYERRGRADVVSFVRRLVGNVTTSHHLFGNYSAAVCDGTAEASVRVRAHYQGSGDGDVFVDVAGSLAGELVLTRDGWRFRHLDHALVVIGGTPELFPSKHELMAAERPARRS